MLCGLVYGRYAAAALHTTTKHHFNHTNTIKKALAVVLIHFKKLSAKSHKNVFTDFGQSSKEQKTVGGVQAKVI